MSPTVTQAKTAVKKRRTGRQLRIFLDYKYPERIIPCVLDYEKYFSDKMHSEMEYLQLAFGL